MKQLAIGMAVFCSVMAASVAAWCGDNGNGTVTVNGQIWLKDNDCLHFMTWTESVVRANSLADGQCGLTDKSKAGDWRLPTIEELKSVYPAKGQFRSTYGKFYWSKNDYDAEKVWVLWAYNGDIYTDLKANKQNYSWPVRVGQ